MTKIVWLSHVLNEKTPVYGGGRAFLTEPVKSLAKGDACNTALWHLPNHVGTHVDAPRHFFARGRTIDSYEPKFWSFERVNVVGVALGEAEILIGPERVLPFLAEDADLLLIKTDFGRYRSKTAYRAANPGLSPDLARELRVQYPNLRAVGIDFISVSSWLDRDAGRAAHRAFLDPDAPGAPIILIEDMDLSPLTGAMRIRQVIVLPLRVQEADGAPCTVVAEVAEAGEGE